MLKELDISHSYFYECPELRNTTYKKINLSSNRISVLWNDNFPDNVEELDLHSNRLLDDGLLSVWPDSIHTLNLSFNLFTSFSSILHWPLHLKHLTISHTMLEGPLPILPDTIEVLNISNTYISSIQHLPANLQTLDASRTILVALPYRLPENILHVNISECKLKNSGLPKIWGSKLQQLNLRYNRLKSVPHNLPETLLDLNVSNNFISEISKPIPNSVECFNISSNHLRVVPSWLFHRRHLKSILHFNHLIDIPIGDNIIASFGQWDEEKYAKAANVISRNWRRLRLRRRLRAYYKNSQLKFPLLDHVLEPERIERLWGTEKFLQLFY